MENKELDKLIEEIEQGKNLEGTHLVSHFKSLIGVYNTEKQDVKFLEDIAWYANKSGKGRTAKAIAEHVISYYRKNYIEGKKSDLLISIKVAKLEVEILGK